MPLNLKQYQRLKEEVDKAVAEASKAEGAYNEAMAKLKKDFKCDTPEEAKKKLRNLEQDLEKADKDFNKQLDELDQEWSDALNKPTQERG